MKLAVRFALWVVLSATIFAQVQAAPITYSGSSGNLSASVTFDISGTNLLVTLKNTSSVDALIPVDILTAVFFNIAGNPVLGSASAIVSTGSSVLFGTTDPGNSVGGEWGYFNNLNQYNANSGISSSGLGVFGGPTFPGSNLQGPVALDGLQYGITAAGDDETTGNQMVTGSHALIKNSVDFILSGFTGSLSDIGNITFQYGTALNEGHFSGCLNGQNCNQVPEPISLALFALGLAIAVSLSRSYKIRYNKKN